MNQWEQTYPLSPSGELRVEQRVGKVQVTGWDQPNARVAATSEDGDDLTERLEVESDGRLLQVKIDPQATFFGLFRRSKKVDLEIMVPYGVRCNVDSGSGPVKVAGTKGPLSVDTGSGVITVAEVRHADLNTGSGNVVACNVDGDLKVDTGSGTVTVERVRGSVEAETGSGGVTVRVVAGDVDVETGSGGVVMEDIMGAVEIETGSGGVQARRIRGPELQAETGGGSLVLEALDVGRLQANTGSGSIKAVLNIVHPNGDYALETGSGRVTVAVPKNADLTFDVEIHSGRIEHRGLDLKVARSDRDTLQAVMNRGTARLSIEGGNGVLIQPCQDPAPTVAPVQSAEPESTVAVLKAVQGDAALENSDEIKRVLQMVQEGKLTPEEAEEILGALDDEEVRV